MKIIPLLFIALSGIEVIKTSESTKHTIDERDIACHWNIKAQNYDKHNKDQAYRLSCEDSKYDNRCEADNNIYTMGEAISEDKDINISFRS